MPWAMVGPVCAKLALIFSGYITVDKMREAESEVIREHQNVVSALETDSMKRIIQMKVAIWGFPDLLLPLMSLVYL